LFYHAGIPGLLFTGWGSSPALNFGEKLHDIFAKGKEKLDVNSIFWENCMILENFSLGKKPYTGSCYRRKKKPHIQML
jgi:hypothetical protein